MSRNAVISYISLYAKCPPPVRTALASLVAVLLVVGSAGELRAQEREPISFETGIGHLTAVNLYVRDCERALRWYTERLGFEVRLDVVYGSGERVLAIAPPGQETPLIHLVLTTTRESARDPSLVGRQGGWVFEAPDLLDTYMRLRELDVRFTESPTETIEGGLRATFVDLYGNEWVLLEPGGS
jgi:catechol 2,3-dioxygenase-like lactoylglutathione lyase family enzyme